MALAGDVKPGQVIRVDNRFYRVVEVDTHLAGGRMGALAKIRMEDIETGNLTERRYRPEDKVEVVELEKKHLTYSYTDGDLLYFMDPSTFDQIAVPAKLLGRYVEFIRDGEEMTIEFLGENPVRVLTPRFVELKVAQTGAAQHSPDTSVWKEAVLENGMVVQVPLFIATGDRIVLDVETGKYHDRAK